MKTGREIEGREIEGREIEGREIEGRERGSIRADDGWTHVGSLTTQLSHLHA